MAANPKAQVVEIAPKKNRLEKVRSPYLLQHADNPVDWYPWGEEAFEKARREDKPIFLSIGYSTCHWCHVMAHESFEDPVVADLMNRAFVSVKVDREERPDVDHIYMTVCQIMTNGGGWPLSIIMTPDRKPFFAGTYIQKESRFGRMGMMDLIPKVEQAWRTKREELLGSANRVVAHLSMLEQQSKGDAPGENALHLAFRHLAGRFDHKHGGFGIEMKFPMPHQLLYLLRYWKRTGNAGALEMVEKTLIKMRQGGIWDHVGFGFHRYSTDPKWLVPHFEKMLYDQALLLMAYVEAYQATGNTLFKQTADEIASYVLRDMTSKEGGFYSAEDADSQGEEGKFYLWTEAEIRNILDPDTAELVIDAFGIAKEGNFEDEAKGRRTGQNILFARGTLEEIAARRGIEAQEAAQRIEAARQVVFEARKKRPRPFLDDKVLTDWNGLMIGALAMAARVLEKPSYQAAAEKAAQFILTELKGKDGRLNHRYRLGESGLKAHLDDYAFLSFGLIELYESGFDSEYLKEALKLTQDMIMHFTDEKSGAFYLSAKDAEKLLVRAVEFHDGAIPSGNSVAVFNLLRLARMTGNADLEQRASTAAGAFGNAVLASPEAHTMFLLGLDYALGPSVEVVIAGHPEAKDTKALLGALETIYAPNKVVLLRDEGAIETLQSIAPFTKDQPMIGGKATAYVCVEQSCAFPTNDPDRMAALLQQKLSK